MRCEDIIEACMTEEGREASRERREAQEDPIIGWIDDTPIHRSDIGGGYSVG